MDGLERLKLDEGFRPTVYLCSLGFETIGYGTKMPLSHEEKQMIGFKGWVSEKQAEMLLLHRLKKTYKALQKHLPWFEDNEIVRDVLLNMSYQMGVNGVLRFKKTLRLLRDKKYHEASIEMLRSLWAKQTPKRAKRLSDTIAKL